MHIALTAEQEALQQRVRALVAELMTPELREELTRTEAGGPHYHAAVRRLGAEGWLGIGWPEEVGGLGAPPIEEFLFFDEMHRAGFPIPLLTLCTVGPCLLQWGTEAQKAEFLPKILAGECHFSVGYSEPGAGTDLASLQTRADKKDDHWLVNGQKIWISLADHADYLWLACRTDPDQPRHKGLSILMLPMDAPGVSMTPIQNLGDSAIYAVYLEDVKVPLDNLVGPENAGWKLVTSQLNHERVALMMVGPLARLLEETRAWAASTPGEGDGTVLDEAWVQQSIAWVDAHLEALRLLNWRQAWNLGRHVLTPQEASAIKVFGSEFYVEAHRRLLEIVGAAGLIKRGSPGAVLHGHLERHYRATLVLTFGGGTNEVQRDIISQVGLGLPRRRS